MYSKTSVTCGANNVLFEYIMQTMDAHHAVEAGKQKSRKFLEEWRNAASGVLFLVFITHSVNG